MSESPSNGVCFSVEGQLFNFNTDELCEASEYFRAMLSGNFSESYKENIVLEDINVYLFTIFHEWLTTPDADLALPALQTDDLIQLIYLTARFFATKLMYFCNHEVLRRLQNEKCSFHELEWETPFRKESRNQKITLFCQFFEAAEVIANTELKEMCVKWLLQESFSSQETDTLESLLNEKRLMENFIEVDQIKNICNMLGEAESSVLIKMISEHSKEPIDAIEKQIERKKKENIWKHMEEYSRTTQPSRDIYLQLIELLSNLNNRSG